MKNGVMITPDAIVAMDCAVVEFRRMLTSRCRIIASSNKLVDQATVLNAYETVVAEIYRKLNNDVDRSAA